jgi:hypothetical protein
MSSQFHYHPDEDNTNNTTTYCAQIKQQWNRYFNTEYSPSNEWCKLTLRLADAFSCGGPLFDLISYKTITTAKGYAF